MVIPVGSCWEMAVTEKDFARLLARIEALSQAQMLALDAAIRGRLNSASQQLAPSAGLAGEAAAAEGLASIAAIEARFAAAPVCPRCQSSDAGKWGSANALKRY